MWDDESEGSYLSGFYCISKGNPKKKGVINVFLITDIRHNMKVRFKRKKLI